tara:strand:- start:816 stop:1136 length:321 start_codon:yes stop_codon:yes gene_type:complete
MKGKGGFMQQLIESFQTYYGLDWAVLGLGLYANMLIANKKKIGFLINILACMCGFSVAVISGQFGFVVFNCIMIAIMGKGFLNWNAEKTPLLQARQTDDQGIIAKI